MNSPIPYLLLTLLFSAIPLRAQESTNSVGATNTAPSSLAPESTNPVAAVATPPTTEEKTISVPAPVSVPAGPALNNQQTTAGLNTAATRADNPYDAARSHDNLVWIALAGVSVISIAAIVVTWQTSKRNQAPAPVVARTEVPAPLAPNLLPVISQAIKEALMQELAAQRRELLSAQQSAAAELAALARRLEAIQTPMLERLGGLRPASSPVTPFSRDLPVKIYCACGQKYSFEVQPVTGRMPFTVVCPACGQDGTQQANQFIARIMNSITQPLPLPGGAALLNASPVTAINSQLVDAVKQAVVKELSPAPAEAPKTVALSVVHKSQNGQATMETHAGDFVASLMVEGQSLMDAGELDKAAKCFDTALTLDPRRAEALVKMGSALDKLDRADEALEYYDRAIALDETLTIAYLNKGGLFNRLARYDEALRCYEQALHKQKKSAA